MLLWSAILTASLTAVQLSLSHATQREPRLTYARCDELSTSIMLCILTTSESRAIAGSGVAERMAKELQLQMLTHPGISTRMFHHSLAQLPWATVWRCAHTALWGAVVVPLLIDAPKVAHALRCFQKHGVAVPVEEQQKPSVQNFQHNKYVWNTFKIGAGCVLLAMLFFMAFFALHRCLLGKDAPSRRVQKLQKVVGPIEKSDDQWMELPRKKGESAHFFRMFTGASLGSDAMDRQHTT